MRECLPKTEGRVETGVIKFKDDWPGIFIRGDNALAESGELQYIIKHFDEIDNEIIKKKLNFLAKLFEECGI